MRKLVALLILLFLAALGYTRCQPAPVPVVVRSLVPRVYIPYVPKPPFVTRKGVAGFSRLAPVPGAYPTMGAYDAYNWNQLCQSVFLSGYGLQCNHSLRSSATRTWNVFDGDGCGGTEAALKACTEARAAAYPGRVWLVGNEPDGGDPNASDVLTPTQAAEKYGELLRTVRAADPGALTYCCGWVVPFDVNQHPTQFLAAYQARWGYPLANDLTGMHFHVYSILNSTCSTVETACLQAKFQSSLSAALAWRDANLPGLPARVTEFNWTPFNNQQTQALFAARLPAMCAALIAAGVEAFYVFYGMGVNEMPGPEYANFALLDSNYALTQAGAAYRTCENGNPPPYP